MKQLIRSSKFLAGPVILITLLTGCGERSVSLPPSATPAATPSPPATASPSPTATVTVTYTPTSTPTATPSPTITPTPTSTSTPTVTPTPTPHPMTAYTIEGLRQRTFPGGEIQVRSVLTETELFTRYYIDYPSDELTITGVMQIPRQGEAPYPVVVLNHGYIPPARYWSGADTWKAAEYLNGRGYATLSPDFRGWGQSDSGDNFFRTGLLIDALNLVSSLSSVPELDPERVGMWGHSMGGGVTTKAITVDPRLKAAILYAPVSGHDAEVVARWGANVRLNMDEELMRAYLDALLRPDFLERTSPINHFELISAPIQIHIGTADRSTPPEWAAAINEALQAAGREVDYFTYAGQGHALEGDSWELFMDRVSDFFDQHVRQLTISN